MENSFKIYFINLKDRKSRWEAFVRHAKFYPSFILDCCERIEAFDSRSNISFLKGLNLKLDPVSAPHILYFSQGRGAVGCYASHYNCWTKILEDNVERALILEDDVDFHDVFAWLSQNPDLDESIELHHLGHRGFDGLEAYVLDQSGANKLVSLTHDSSPLQGHIQIQLSGSFSNQDPLQFQYFKENSTYSFQKQNSITSPVDKFVGYCSTGTLDASIKLRTQFTPSISLSPSAYESSDIENENYKRLFNTMSEYEINDLIASEDYKWWDEKATPINYNNNIPTPNLNKPRNTGKKLTVCICTYNNYKLLNSCLHYLSSQSAKKEDFDVLVLDNTSEEALPNLDDKTFISVIEKCDLEENFTYIHEETDGLSGARNRCVELSDSELIHFIDDDSLAHPNFVQETLNSFAKYKDLHVLGGKTLANWGDYGKPHWMGDRLLGLLSMLDLGDKEIAFNDLPSNKKWFVGANICFTKDSILKYGGFDTSLGRKGATNSLLGGEENELLHKIAKENFVIYSPNVVVDHVVSRERLDQSWFLKRVGWQSVSEIMANDTWLDREYGVDQFIKENINYLFEDCQTEDCLDKKMQLVQFLVFKLLNNGEL